MADDEKLKKGWFYTLPGIITTLTAIVTALSGLAIALSATGLFRWVESAFHPVVVTPPPHVSPEPVKGPAGAAYDRAQIVPPPLAGPRTKYPVVLPELREYTLGSEVYTLLEADVAPRTNETDTLRIRVRLWNHCRFDALFFPTSFRLLVAGLPQEPSNSLIESVASDTAKERDVTFAVPHGTMTADLVIKAEGVCSVGIRTKIPLDLSPRP